MNEKIKLLLVVLILLGISIYAQENHARKKDAFDMLPDKSKDKLIEMYLKEYKYTESKEFKNYPETLNQFFTLPIYQKLNGNFIRGYHYDEGFSYEGDTVYLKELKTISDIGSYLKPFVDCLNKVAKVADIKFVEKDKSDIEMGLCIVAVEPKLTETTFPGLFIETYFFNKKTRKTYFYRFGQGSKIGLEKAMIDSSMMILATLKSVGKSK